jgi:hypothetical protein
MFVCHEVCMALLAPNKSNHNDEDKSWASKPFDSVDTFGSFRSSLRTLAQPGKLRSVRSYWLHFSAMICEPLGVHATSSHPPRPAGIGWMFAKFRTPKKLLNSSEQVYLMAASGCARNHQREQLTQVVLPSPKGSGSPPAVLPSPPMRSLPPLLI